MGGHGVAKFTIGRESRHGNPSAYHVCHEAQKSPLPEVRRQAEYAASALPTLQPTAKPAEKVTSSDNVPSLSQGPSLAFVLRILNGFHTNSLQICAVACCLFEETCFFSQKWTRNLKRDSVLEAFSIGNVRILHRFVIFHDVQAACFLARRACTR
jgi:hypothetical protein